MYLYPIGYGTNMKFWKGSMRFWKMLKIKWLQCQMVRWNMFVLRSVLRENNTLSQIAWESETFWIVLLWFWTQFLSKKHLDFKKRIYRKHSTGLKWRKTDAVWKLVFLETDDCLKCKFGNSLDSSIWIGNRWLSWMKIWKQSRLF